MSDKRAGAAVERYQEVPEPESGRLKRERPSGAALIRGILASNVHGDGYLFVSFSPATQAELLRIAETLEIAEAMESLAPADRTPPSDPDADDVQEWRCHVCGRWNSALACPECGTACTAFTSLLRARPAHAPEPEPERAGADAMREAWIAVIAYHERKVAKLRKSIEKACRWSMEHNDGNPNLGGTAYMVDAPIEIRVHEAAVRHFRAALAREVPCG